MNVLLGVGNADPLPVELGFDTLGEVEMDRPVLLGPDPRSDHEVHTGIRELDHAIERAVLMATGEELGRDDFVAPASKRTTSAGGPDYESMTLEQAECALIKRALQRAVGSTLAWAEVEAKIVRLHTMRPVASSTNRRSAVTFVPRPLA